MIIRSGQFGYPLVVSIEHRALKGPGHSSYFLVHESIHIFASCIGKHALCVRNNQLHNLRTVAAANGLCFGVEGFDVFREMGKFEAMRGIKGSLAIVVGGCHGHRWPMHITSASFVQAAWEDSVSYYIHVPTGELSCFFFFTKISLKALWWRLRGARKKHAF